MVTVARRALAMAMFSLAVPAALAASFPLQLPAFRQALPINRAEVRCERPNHPLEQVLWQKTLGSGAEYSCGNAFVRYLHTPRTPERPDAFTLMADDIKTARAEVLIAMMQWDRADTDPGATIVQALRELYDQVKAQPAQYPAGMQIYIALGSYPDFRRPFEEAQVISLTRRLLATGIPFVDRQAGWTLRLGDYRYFPHSHVKMLVVDGQKLVVAGYNFADVHLPLGEVGGIGLGDLGLEMRGPVAQQGVAVFDDLWSLSNEMRCPASAHRAEDCTWGQTTPLHHADLTLTAQTAGTARAFLLYRRPGYQQADQAHHALFQVARATLDIWQGNFSPGAECVLNYLQPNDCPANDWPPYMRGTLGALERGVRVRLLLSDQSFDRLPNRSGLALLRLEARKRGVESLLEVRYSRQPMHHKAMIVDGELVLVGSMNLHFSAWGPLGLNEAMLATSDAQAVSELQREFADAWTQGQEAAQESWMRNVQAPATGLQGKP